MNGTASAEKNRQLFEVMPVPKAITKLAVPTVIGQLIILIYNLADTFFIGRTNDPLMVAGASLILPVYNIAISIACVAGVGGGSLISRLLGVHKDGDAKRISSFSLYFSVLLSGLFSVLTLIFMNSLLSLLGASGDVENYAREYALCVIVIGGIPTVVSMTMANLLRSVGFASKAGFGVSMGGIINIILDPLLMFVILPKGKEIVGAGIATAISNVIVCIFFTVVILRVRKESVLNFDPRKLHISRAEFGDILSVGVPSAVATLLFDIAYVIIDKLASGYGDIPLAAVGIVLKAERFPLNIGVGLCQAMMPIAAYNYSSGNYARMKESIGFTRIVGLVIAAFSIVVYEVFAGNIMALFIDDAQTVAIGTNFLRIRCLATPFMFLCFHVVHLYQAIGKGRTALILGVLRWAAFNIPMLYLLNMMFGMYGIVWTQAVADFMVAMISLIVAGKFTKKIVSGTYSELS